MIILDTNVVSALMRDVPERPVVGWLDRQPPESIWITSVTVFEVRLGIELLAASRRRAGLQAAFGALVSEALQDRVLEFDAPAAAQSAAIAARRQRAGRPVDLRDTQIAGIALARRATLATRNGRHFEGLDVRVVNPWETDAR